MSKFNNEFVKGVLKTQGTRFVNGEGQEIILHGYGTANWENVEGFMIGGPPTPIDVFKFYLFPGPGRDHNPERWTTRRTVSQTIRELCGSEYLASFWDRWEENHLREEDIKLMAELGYNCVRVVLNANALLYEEPGIHFNEKGFGRLTNVIDWCEKYRIYVILDMHGVVGGNNGATGDGLFCEYPSVFLDEESTERQILLWEEIVRRYGKRWIIAGYDLINEPVSSPVQHEYIPLLAKYYDECIRRLRKLDKEHIFFLEGAKFARDMRIFDHNYDPECNNWAISIHLSPFTTASSPTSALTTAWPTPPGPGRRPWAAPTPPAPSAIRCRRTGTRFRPSSSAARVRAMPSLSASWTSTLS